MNTKSSILLAVFLLVVGFCFVFAVHNGTNVKVSGDAFRIVHLEFSSTQPNTAQEVKATTTP